MLSTRPASFVPSSDSRMNRSSAALETPWFHVMGGRGFQLMLATLAMMTCAYARASVGPLQEAMRTALKLSDNQIAVLQGPALALPVVLAAVPLGLIIDRRSRVRLLCIFSACDLVGTLLTAFATNFTLLVLARGLVGLTASAVNTTVPSFICDLFAAEERGRVSIVTAAGQFAGMAAVFALGGWLLSVFDPDPNAWRWALLLISIPMVLTIISVVLMREPARTGVRIENPSWRETLDLLWRRRAAVTPIFFGMVLAEIGIGATMVWAAPMLSRSFGVTSDRVGAIMATGLLVSGIAGPIVGGMLADFCQRTGGPRRTLIVLCGVMLLAVPASLFPLTHGSFSASVLLVASMTLVCAVLVMGGVIFSIVIPNELRGLCMAGLGAAAVLFAVGVAPLTVSTLSGAIGGAPMIGQSLAWIGVASNLLATGVFALGLRSVARVASY